MVNILPRASSHNFPRPVAVNKSSCIPRLCKKIPEGYQIFSFLLGEYPSLDVIECNSISISLLCSVQSL